MRLNRWHYLSGKFEWMTFREKRARTMTPVEAAWMVIVTSWSGQGDSNSQPPAPKAGALPLRHVQVVLLLSTDDNVSTNEPLARLELARCPLRRRMPCPLGLQGRRGGRDM